MESKCIYKVDGGKGIYRVCKQTLKGGCVVFAVLKDRRFALPVSTFDKAILAIAVANRAAYKDYQEINNLIHTL